MIFHTRYRVERTLTIWMFNWYRNETKKNIFARMLGKGKKKTSSWHSRPICSARWNVKLVDTFFQLNMIDSQKLLSCKIKAATLQTISTRSKSSSLSLSQKKKKKKKSEKLITQYASLHSFILERQNNPPLPQNIIIPARATFAPAARQSKHARPHPDLTPRTRSIFPQPPSLYTYTQLDVKEKSSHHTHKTSFSPSACTD